MKITKILIVPISLALTLILLLIEMTGMLDGGWYSLTNIYLRQTDAILNGHLWLHKSPYAIGWDFAWGEDVQQIWGLGIPFLQLLFEAPSRILGYAFFPDRLIFLFYYGLSIIVFYTGVKSALDQKLNSRYTTYWTILITIFCLLQPIIVTLLETRFLQYEEAVIYMVIWSMMLVGVLLHLTTKPRPQLFFLVVFLAGFTPLIRPTGTFYATSIGLCALLLMWQQNKLTWRLFFASGFFFLIGPVVFLITNDIRYGHPFEFGQALSISGLVPSLMSVNFGFPFIHESFYLAAKEVIGALFFTKNLTLSFGGVLDFYTQNLNPWQAPTVRLREIVFYAYQPLHLTLMLFGLLIFLTPKILVNKLKHTNVKLYAMCADIPTSYKYLALFSSLSFVQMMIFYMYTPSITSRYLVDFYPAIIIGTILGFLLILRILQSFLLPAIFGAITAVIIVSLSAWWIVNIINAPEKKSSLYKETINKTHTNSRYTTLKSISYYKNLKKDQPIPKKWICRNLDYSSLQNILFFAGLKLPDSKNPVPDEYNCWVSILTQIFLPDFECLRLKIKTGFSDSILTPYQIKWIQVKKGRDFLERTNINWHNGRFEVVFCDTKLPTYSKTPQVIRISWLPGEYYTGGTNNPPIPIYLEEISVVDKK